LHELDNKGGSKNINGVYQFVTKIYEAQTYNYGKRTMLEFMIPEPGAFLFDGLNNKASALPVIDIPDVPAFTLQATQVIEDNYQSLAYHFGVTDIEPPPRSRDSKNYQHSQPTQDIGMSVAFSETIEIPVGFEVDFIGITFNSHRHKTDCSASVTVGNLSRSIRTAVAVDTHSDVGMMQRGFIPLTVTTYNLSSCAIAADISLKRTDEAFAAWQFSCWTKITAARARLQSEHDAKEAALNAQAAAEAYNRDPSSIVNPGIKGINPIFNQQIMRDEIKKACISIITDQHFDDFNAIKDESGLSQVDLFQAAGEGP
jgi:hypothetical protein